MTNAEAIKNLTALRTASELAWEGAYEDDKHWRAQAEACDEYYGDALSALENENLKGAERSLMAANDLESEAGDNSHAHAALKIVRGLIATASNERFSRATTELGDELLVDEE